MNSNERQNHVMRLVEILQKARIEPDNDMAAAMIALGVSFFINNGFPMAEAKKFVDDIFADLKDGSVLLDN